MEIAVMQQPGSATGTGARELTGRLLELGGAAYRMSVHALGSADAAEDVVQQAYLEAFKQLRAGFAPAEVRPWFLKVVNNTAWKHLRGEARRARRESVVRTERENVAPAGPDAGLVLALRQALSALEREHRLPLALCYEEGLSRQEAAAVLDLPETTLRRRLDEGLERLRKALAGAGYTAAPAAIIGGLVHAAPPVPATLAAALEKLVADGAAVKGAGAVAAGAAKGGLIVKIGLGVAAVGLAAGVTFWAVGGKAEDKPAPAAAAEVAHGRALYAEHFAFAGVPLAEGLGGPAREAVRGAIGQAQSWGNIDDKGNFYLADPENSQIHWVSPEGTDRILAGDGKKGFRDGPADQARFDLADSYNDCAINIDADGNVYVSDGQNSRLRKISRREDGTWHVTTVSGGGSVSYEAIKKGQWVKATDLKFGCASKFAVKRDGSAAYYVKWGGLYKALLKENKATILVPTSELRAAGLTKEYADWHVGGSHLTDDGVYYWMPGGQIMWRFDESSGKVERFASGTRPGGDDAIGLGRLEAGFGTVSAAYARNAKVIYFGGGDEGAVLRRIYADKAEHLMKDGSWRQRSQSLRPEGWVLAFPICVDAEGRYYGASWAYAWPRWVERITFAKE